MAISNNTQMANREVCNCVFLDYATQKPYLYVDYANTTTTEMSGNIVKAYGGQGRPAKISFSGEKEGTVKIETQITPFKFFSVLTGASMETTAKYIKREKLKTTALGAITLSVAAVGDINVFEADDDCGTAKTVTGTGTAFTITGITEVTDVIAYYWINKTTGVEKLAIKNTTFPRAFTFQGDTLYKTTGDVDVVARQIIYKCSPQPAFSLSYANSGDPVTVTMTCDMLCDDNGNMMDYILEEDA
jgi:hypothetical protein